MTTTRQLALRYLRYLIKKWGGTLEVFSKDKYKEIEEHIYKHRRKSQWSTSTESGYALHWESKRIIILDECDDPGTIIHEMGHCFLDKNGPENSDEFSWLGWEICLARKAGCYRTWSMQNSDYHLGSEYSTSGINISWVELSRYNRIQLIANRIEYGKSIGVISHANDPIPLR